jgi:hypothetical protein
LRLKTGKEMRLIGLSINSLPTVIVALLLAGCASAPLDYPKSESTAIAGQPSRNTDAMDTRTDSLRGLRSAPTGTWY